MTFKRANKSYPVIPYNFVVYIQIVKMGFSRITNIENTIELESFTEGGLNDYVHSLRAPTTMEKIIVFERGIVYPTISLPFIDDTYFDIGKVGSKIGHDIIIMVLNANRQPEKTYCVSGGIIKSWKLSEFDANSNQVLIERFEVVYQTIEAKRISLPLNRLPSF